MLSRILPGTMLALFGMSAAMAADLPVKAPYVKAPMMPPVFNWTGWYAGINGGYGWGDPSVTIDPGNGGTPFTLSTKPKGGLVGGQIGYNWQLDRLVVGAEFDFDYAHLRDSTSGAFSNSFTDSTGATITQTGTATLESRVDWISTLRGRIGYAFDRVLPYATGGLAVAHMKSTVTISTITNTSTVTGGGGGGGGGGGNSDFRTDAISLADLTTSASSAATVSDTLWGYAVGGGLDVAIDPRWVLRAEYLFLGFEKKDHGAVIPGITSFQNGMNVQTVRAALSYRF
jgi:outer membrane immunogenic protein